MAFFTNTQQIIRYRFFEESLASYLRLALSYIWSPNISHRSFTLGTAAINILCIIVFAFYAVAEKYQIVDSALYGNPRFSLSDNSYLETFGYFLEIFSICMFLAIGYAHKQYYWFAWALIFLVIFIDDSYHLHEYVRNYLGAEHGISRVSGEIVGYALLGGPIIMLWITGLFFGPPTPKQQQSYLLFSVYFGMLLVFGIGVDQIHEMIQGHIHISETIMALIEDGMEQFFISLTAISTLGMWCAEKHKLGWKE